MKKAIIVIALLATMLAMAASWKTVTIANETIVVSDTLSKVWLGKVTPAKFYVFPGDSITFYVEGSDSAAVDVKLLTYTVTGGLADTITVAEKAVGDKFTTVTVSTATIPSYVFNMRPIVTVSNSATVKTKPINFKTIIIYKEQ